MRMLAVGVLIAALGVCVGVSAEVRTGEDPVANDPRFDPAYPPKTDGVTFEIEGSRVYGVIYQAAGAGPHPTMLLLHGYPGNEKNGDLAQAMRRAGSNVVTFSYRGMWGSQGTYTGASAYEDVEQVIARIREPQWAAQYRADPAKIGIAGYSFGGGLGAIAARRDPAIACYVHIAGNDLGINGQWLRANPDQTAKLRAGMQREFDAGDVPVRGSAAELIKSGIDAADGFALVPAAAELATRPVLLVTGLKDTAVPKAANHDPFMAALRKAGAQRASEAVFDDGHDFAAHRLAMIRKVVEWQQSECWR